MVQLLTTSYYLQKVIYLIIIINKIERKIFIYFFLIFLNLAKMLFRKSQDGICQNDSLGVILLGDIFLQFKKGRNDLTDTYGG